MALSIASRDRTAVARRRAKGNRRVHPLTPQLPSSWCARREHDDRLLVSAIQPAVVHRFAPRDRRANGTTVVAISDSQDHIGDSTRSRCDDSRRTTQLRNESSSDKTRATARRELLDARRGPTALLGPPLPRSRPPTGRFGLDPEQATACGAGGVARRPRRFESSLCAAARAAIAIPARRAARNDVRRHGPSCERRTRRAHADGVRSGR
jgi:hypothetical protein